MTRPVPSHPREYHPAKVVPAGRELFLAAARRLVSQLNADVEQAARMLVESASSHGIDPDLCWISLAQESPVPTANQACLTVLGAGRTAMMFLSEPKQGNPESAQMRNERTECVRAACEHLRKKHAKDVHVVQALPEPEEPWAIESLEEAGFIRVGILAYMRRAPQPAGRVKVSDGAWPEGIRIESAARLGAGRELDTILIEALDSTYVETLDCPELCGLRDTADVLVSHRSTGVHDPHLWWVVFHQDQPRGCLLLNPCPEQRSAELVYLGLAPEVRGKGIGKRLLEMGMRQATRGHADWSVMCAVDSRNTPAQNLYRRLGFVAVSHRVAMVRSMRASAGA